MYCAIFRDTNRRIKKTKKVKKRDTFYDEVELSLSDALGRKVVVKESTTETWIVCNFPKKYDYYSEVIKYRFIDEHTKIIHKAKYVWMMKMGKKTSVEKIKDIIKNGFIYDEDEGLPERGVEPGTPFSELADAFKCPKCGVGKSMFKEVE